MKDVKVISKKTKQPTDRLKKKVKADSSIAKLIDKELSKENPDILATPTIELTSSNPLKAINLLFPPGVSRFYVERVDKTHIRFIINAKEIHRLSQKAEEIMSAKKVD